MIAVVGIPAWSAAEPAAPAGRACEVAVAAASRGARVELVGRAGDDAAGDALVIALAAAGVGHAAILRDPVRATPIVAAPAEAGADGGDLLGGKPPVAAANGIAVPDAARDAGPDAVTRAAPRLEPADVALGLQYLTAFAVLVVADDVPADALPAAVEAAQFAGAHLLLLVPGGGPVPAVVPLDAIVLEAPAEADDGAFGALVGAYAAALDAGEDPAAAFRVATGAAGWEEIRDGDPFRSGAPF